MTELTIRALNPGDISSSNFPFSLKKLSEKECGQGSLNGCREVRMTPTMNYLQLRQFHRLNLNFSSITIEEGGAMSQFRSLAERSLFRPIAGTCSNFLVINLQF